MDGWACLCLYGEREQNACALGELDHLSTEENKHHEYSAPSKRQHA
jgi:hypothetical protein